MNTVLFDVPTLIETERLELRMPQPGDGRAVNAAIKASLSELQPWLGFARSNPSVEETETNTREAHAKFITRESLRYLIFLKDTNEFVGSTGFHNIDWSVPKFEIGYWIDTRMSGNGYMAEAVGKLTEMALNELNGKRVEIRCESTNDKSRAVPERLGYELEGILRNEDLSVDGERLTDTCVYGKISGSRMT
ncbi:MULTISPECIES: GNAT family N-acetyltransferase [Rossellomorea]|uniref:GNAT family N-acetyltransferase n=1 Tax=Rossellomorea TaxID=2837508 RepID=UPI001CCA807C|nr:MULTISPECIES: GNAT family N-acetyltransferase [Rossellomorea]MCA0148422.1 GNAT family N-acetyltransferase [Rossellomorea vietnamensis]WGG47766.1 GNAT family N-acetyltransferase [Rossellomorea sp. DA94]